MPPFKDESVLIIAPGSYTTAAQYGIPETYCPPKFTFPSRMFKVEGGGWSHVNIKKTTKLKQVNGAPQVNGEVKEAITNGETKPDVEMTDSAPVEESAVVEISAQATEVKSTDAATHETEDTYEADPDDEEGAVWPIVEGRIVNWSAFFALLEHIRNALNPHFHSPLLIVSQPAWIPKDLEAITQFVFQSWSVPVFVMIDAAIAATYGYGIPNALIVDVGFDKCDVTAVVDFLCAECHRAVSLQECGGRSMTKRIQEALKRSKINVSESVVEQLKKSPICEILLPGVSIPTAKPSDVEVRNPAAAASTGAVDSGTNATEADGSKPGLEPRGPGAGTQVGEEGEEDNDGVLDVAAIVAQNNAAELLAKREQEKAAKAAAKKGGTAEPPKAVRLKNSEKEKATFTYEESFQADDERTADAQTPSRRRKREMEVGTQRFMASMPSEGEMDGIIDKIADAMHLVVLGVPDVPARSSLWENIVIMGNGSRIKGFKETLLATLQARFVLSPSTATMFTSELPSNFTTPVATPGTNTPIPGQPGHPMHHPAGHGVNPLLLAATRNVMQPHPGQHLQVPGHSTPIPTDPNAWQQHRGYSQTPLNIKQAKIPEYFPDMKDPKHVGWEEAAWVGAQEAAKMVFIIEQKEKHFMSRTDYNDAGPTEIWNYLIQ